MTDLATRNPYGMLTEPATLTIRRLLPGPADRVWSYLVDGDLRRKWLAAGAMEAKAGAPFEFVWRNDELDDPPGRRPEGFPEEHRMAGRILEIDPPRRLVITWGTEGGSVAFDLTQQGDNVLLTVTHRRLVDRASMLNVSAGWHMHLDVLASVMTGEPRETFWSGWQRLKGEYAQRLPA
jgi:uncharacterized protein YndB with AHSA1/START domain